MSVVKHKHIPGLDGIRGIAFLMVYLSHMGLGHSYTGGLGVAVFFFLSGFLITTLLKAEFLASSTISVTSFYIRRIFRILPPLYVMLVFGALLHLIHLASGRPLAAYLSVLFYFSNYRLYYHGDMGWLAPTWSLSVEEHFYFVFPFLFLAIAKLSKKNQVWILGSLCVAALVWRCILEYGIHMDRPRTYLLTDARFDSILLGSICALALNPLYDRIPGWFTRRPQLWAIVGVFLVLTVDHIPMVNRALSYTVLGLALFPVFWYVIIYYDLPSASWLENDKLRVIGRWSYSMYLVHQLLIGAAEFAAPGIRPTFAALAAFIPCLLFGWAVEKFIEKPSHQLRNNILKRMAIKSKLKAAAADSSPVSAAS